MVFRTIEDVGLKAMEHSYILMPVLLAFFRDGGDSIVAKQSIVTGTNFFCRFLEDTALQVSLCFSRLVIIFIISSMLYKKIFCNNSE